MTEIANRLLAVRKSKDLTQKDMAVLLGIPYRTLQDQERGLVQPSASTFAAYAEIGVDLNWLVVGNELPKPTFVNGDQFKLTEPRTVNIEPFLAPNSSGEDDQSTLIISRNFIRGGTGGKSNLENLVWSKQGDNALKPIIEKGAVMIIDTAAIQRVGTYIYYLETAGGYAARRVAQTENGFLVVSNGDKNGLSVHTSAEHSSVNIAGRVTYVINPVK